MSLIDTHAHVDLPDYDGDRNEMLKRARRANVHAIVAIGHNPDRWRSTAMLCSRDQSVVRTAGVHPNDATIWNDETAMNLESELASGGPIAVGETGLDFFRESTSPGIQREAFIGQIELARQFDLPIVIHQRNAEQDVIDMLRQHGPVRGIMHCFGGGIDFAWSCLESGLMLGVGGVATYPKSTQVRDALVSVPLDSIVVETDAPYLSPQKWRGKRNEPSYIVAVVETLANLHEVSVEAIAERTSANALRLFGERLASAQTFGQGAD